MTSALAATAAMSVGAVAATLALHPLVAFSGFALALAVLLAPRVLAADPLGERTARASVAVAVVAAVVDRHLHVASSVVAPDDLLALLVVVGAVLLPRGPRWAAIAAGAVLATYLVVGATLIAATPYHSDAVVAAHGGADLVLAGRHPYAEFDMVAQLARFGLPPEFATPLEDGTRLRSLQYPALALLVPAPFVAAGLGDLRALYLVEVIAIFAVAILAARPRWRALALAACVGNLVVLDQFVLAGVDPLWALLVLGAWTARRHPASAVLLGLAVASRQPAWLVAPFVMVWTARAMGSRAAAGRAAVALAIALAIHAPFLAGAPGAVIEGVAAPALLPLEPWGVGPAKLAADVAGGPVPRAVYVIAAGAAYLLGLWAFATGRARGALVLPLVPLWISWRALQSYFAFIPIFAMTEEERYDHADAGR